METVRLQETNSIAVSELECPHDQAYTLSTFPIWAVSEPWSCHKPETHLVQEILYHHGIEEHEVGRMDR